MITFLIIVSYILLGLISARLVEKFDSNTIGDSLGYTSFVLFWPIPMLFYVTDAILYIIYVIINSSEYLRKLMRKLIP